MSKAPPPEPLPQSTILALQAWQDKNKISNANWENKLNEAVTVNNGDSIFVKASFIDTRGTASGNIDLAVDTEISLEYYFYWIHTFNACDASGLIQAPTQPDASNNLNQQVLVGGPINYLMGKAVPNIPAYYTSNTNNSNCAATNINDADGLPYLVMQSTNNYPVAPIIGNSVDALNIVVNDIYIVTKIGLVTNWQYAGLIGANYNQLPAGWNLSTNFFTATHNPNLNLPPSAFIPAALAAPLPYVQYVITEIGNTDWAAIDPALVKTTVRALDMTDHTVYSIASLGNLDFTAWGAASNDIGQVFTSDFSVNKKLRPFPVTIPNSEFHKNPSWFQPNGGPIFGDDPEDSFAVQIFMDDSGNLSISDIAGQGSWLRSYDGIPRGQWAIPGSVFGFSAATPSASQYVFITDIVVSIGELSVNNLQAGTTYYPSNLGILDNSVPQFTWNMVDSTLPTTTTSNMTVGTSYQVVAPQSSVYISDLSGAALVSQIFTCSNATVPGATQSYNVSSNPTIQAVCTLENEVGVQYMNYLVANYEAGITVTQNNTGGYTYAPYSASVLGSGSHSGSPFSELPSGAPVSSNVLTLTINPSVASGNTNPITFTSTLAGGEFDEGNVYTMTSPDLYPQPQNLVAFQPADAFVATSASDSANTVATVQSYSVTSATISGNGWIDGTVNRGIIQVGTVVNAINPDPALPADSGGRANLDPSQYNSTIPYQYDGYVASYVPASTRFDVRPVKKRWSMTIPRGSYNPNYLAELISRNMSRQKIKRVNNVQGAPFGTQSTLNVPTDSIYNNVPTSSNIWANPDARGANTFYDSKNPKVYDYPPALDYNLLPDNTDDMPFLFCPAMNSSILNNDPIDASNNYIYAEIPHPNANGLNNLPNPTYYVNLVPLCSDVRSVSPTLTDINVTQFYGTYSILPFYSQNSLQTGAAPFTGNSGLFPIVFGANQTSLLYNNENNGLFSFNYLHSPIYAFLSSNSTALTECTAHQYNTQKVSTNMNGSNYFTTLVDKKSGILLNKMEPASFWNQLGFNIPSLTVDLDKDPNGYGFYMTLGEFQSKTTGGFCGSSNIFNPIFHTANSADQPNVPDTELIYLTATPTAVPHAANIIPFNNQAPDMVIGTKYIINSLGWFSPAGSYQKYQAVDWSYVGTAVNPNDDITNAYVGMPIIAINNWDGVHYVPYSFEAFWDTGDTSQYPLPSVYLANIPATTSTQLQNTYFQVENTNSLNAAIIPTVRDSTGHYLVELTGYNSNYIDDKSKREIKAIVSAYWVSPGSFVSVPFPDSYNFFQSGSPLTLSGIKVRILDPYTMQEAVIGPNSSIYLQVNKMLTDQAVAQIPV